LWLAAAMVFTSVLDFSNSFSFEDNLVSKSLHSCFDAIPLKWKINISLQKSRMVMEFA
jgi:hypothetical protein